MSATFTTISHLINSPPGQLAAGGLLAGIVWKCFERVEAVLNEDTKLEIAVWLLDVKAQPRISAQVATMMRLVNDPTWPVPFWSRLFISFLIALSHYLVLFLSLAANRGFYAPVGTSFGVPFPVDVLLFASWVFLWFYILVRSMSSVPKRSQSGRIPVMLGVLWAIPLLTVTGVVILSQREPWSLQFSFTWRWATRVSVTVMSISLLFLLLPAVSAVILKAARRFDIGFEWLNRHFDIEKKPLQGIGLVAGALVAIVYWAAVIASRVVG